MNGMRVMESTAGMARCGDIPFVHSFSVFVTRRCFDQIAMQVAYPKLPVKIAGFLESNHKKYSMRGEGSTTLMDLRAGPTVFIGAYDNQWTLRLLKPLRFHFVNDESMTHFGIVDSNSKTPTTWMVDRTQQIATNNYSDYAIVARFTDSTTGKLAVVAAGVGRGGTIAAGELLTDAAQLAPVLRAAGDKHNIELVLSTPIIGGEPGPPRVEASYAW